MKEPNDSILLREKTLENLLKTKEDNKAAFNSGVLNFPSEKKNTLKKIGPEVQL